MLADVHYLGIRADTSDLPRGEKAMDSFADEAERTERRTGKATKGVSRDMAGMARAAKVAAGVVSSAIGGIALGALSAKSITMRRDLSSAISEVSTLLSGEADEMAALEMQARRLATVYGGDATSQAQAYYQAISAGAGSVADATKLLDVANKLAIGGVTDVTTGVDVLTTAMNTYGPTVLSAMQASDTLFVGMRAGKTTIAELAGALGNVIPIAAAAGVSFEEIVAATSALTTQGQTTSVAVTGLRQVLAAIISPTSQAREEAEKLGVAFNTAHLQEVGLAQFLGELITAADGSQTSLAQLFGSVEALNAVLSFAGGGGAKLNDILDDMKNKAGATGTAFSKMAKDDAQRLSVAMAKINDRMLEVGGAMLTALVPAVELTADSMDDLIVGGGVLALTTAPAIIGGLTGMTSAAVVTTGAMTALRVAMSAIPHLAVAAAAVGVYTAFSDRAQLARDLAGALDLAADAQTGLNDVTETFYRNTSRANAEAMQAAAKAARDQIEAALGVAKAQAEADKVVSAWLLLLPGSSTAIEATRIQKSREAIKELESALIDAEARLSATDHAIENFGNATEVAATKAAAAIAPLADRLDALGKAQDRLGTGEGEASVAVLGALAREAHILKEGLREIEQVDTSRAIMDVATAAGTLSDELGLTIDQAIRFDELLRTVRQADTFEAQATALGDVVQFLEQAAGGAAATDDEAKKVYASLLDALKAAVGLAGTDMASTIGAGASEAERLAAWLGVSLSTALALSATTPMMAAEDALMSQSVIPDGEGRAGHRQALANFQSLIKKRSGGGSVKKSAEETAMERAATKVRNELAEATRAAMSYTERYAAEVEELTELKKAGYLTETEFARALKLTAEELRKTELKPVIDEFEELAGVLVDIGFDFDEFGDAFGSMLKRMGRDLAESGLKSAISAIFSSGESSGSSGGGIFGSIVGAIFGGARAGGGSVSAGKSYLVGEKGPELFNPGASGFITPNHMLKGGTAPPPAQPGGQIELLIRADEGVTVETIRNEAGAMIIANNDAQDRALPARVAEINRDPRIR